MNSALLLLVMGNWWNQYGDAELSRIVEQALAKNIDLQIATQRIAEARALTGSAKSRLRPDLNATGSAQRLRGGFAQNIIRIPNPSGAQQSGSFVSPFETGLLQGGLDMKWELDLFGTNKAALKATQSDLVAEEQRKEDLAITVSAEVARYYVQLRGVEERVGILQRNIASQKDLLGLLEDQLQAGLSTQLDVERQRTLIANSEASLAGVQAELDTNRNRLAVLVGDEGFSIRPSAESLKVPSVSGQLPSELLKRRPDVRAAEARLDAAMARLKQARTDLYPKISLNGLVGRQGTSFNTLSLGGGNFFNIGPQLQLPIFNGGRIKSNIEANDARVEQAKLTYQNEILTAFEEAANALANLQRQLEREAKLEAATASVKANRELAMDLQRAGIGDSLAVLDVERSQLDAEYQRSGAHTQVLVESILLYKALAGGWLKN